MNTCFARGDLGDIIAFLPTIRQLGGGELVIGNRNGQGERELMTEARFNAIAPLLRAQTDYITGVRWEDDAQAIDYDVTNFREKPWPTPNYNLATWQAAYFGITDLDLSPWLRVEPSQESAGKAIFARSERYHNSLFDWREIVRQWPGAFFVGFEREWDTFKKELTSAPSSLPSPVRNEGQPHTAGMSQGRKRDDPYPGRMSPTTRMEQAKPAVSEAEIAGVSYRATGDLLEVARLIAGSEIFVGNQSVAFWIAAGLGHRLVQETDICNLNSVVRRDNAQYRGGAGLV